MEINLIVATGKNRAIGLNGQMPWHLPADLKYFKKTTMGYPVIMGRKTFESIGRPLPGRLNIVVSRNKAYEASGCQTVTDLPAAFALAEQENPKACFMIGGGQLYHEILPHAHRVYITEIQESFDADTYFPELTEEWKEISRERHQADEKNPYDYDFVVFEK
ncbi:dihydrofolate reductase [Persicobacter diffluens]|uniref:Dihydrofolate reductase n=1 Tax=Persicobacter diffluens TaxID=981 RepID=A0AAN4VZS6_9BACT|nr:dihydrofolate reductase [Persicobacter diffluens]